MSGFRRPMTERRKLLPRSDFNVKGSNHRRTGTGRPLPGGHPCWQMLIAGSTHQNADISARNKRRTGSALRFRSGDLMPQS
jgi:hypothetical protein